MAATKPDAAPPAPEEDDLGLPGWLNDLLKPGVGQGVFMTLKVSLVLLVLTLCALLIYIEDEVRRRVPKFFLPCPMRCVAVKARELTSSAHDVGCGARADCAPSHEGLSRHVMHTPRARRVVHRRAAAGDGAAGQGVK